MLSRTGNRHATRPPCAAPAAALLRCPRSWTTTSARPRPWTMSSTRLEPGPRAQSVQANLLLQHHATDAERLGGARRVAAVLRQHLRDVLALEQLTGAPQRQVGGRQRPRAARPPRSDAPTGRPARSSRPPAPARPPARSRSAARARCPATRTRLSSSRARGLQPSHRLAELLGRALEQTRDEQRNVLAPLAQRRQGDRERVEPVVEVVAEAPRRDLGGEVAMRGGDDPHVDATRRRCRRPAGTRRPAGRAAA